MNISSIQLARSIESAVHGMTCVRRVFFCLAIVILSRGSDANRDNRVAIAKYWKARSIEVFDDAPVFRNVHVQHRIGTPPTAAIGIEGLLRVRGGGWLIPAGYNPFGYRITSLGEQFLSYDGSRDCDIGRFLASLKDRKRFATLKGQWLEVLRVSKTGQSMRIYKNLQELLTLCLRMGLID